MPAKQFLGLIFVLVLICWPGRTESAILNNEQDQSQTASENSFSIQIPLGSGNVIQADNQVNPTAQRRLSLEDFFLNRNENREEAQPAIPQQVPVTQFQVQQPDPNSLLLVRDAQFPSPTGGIISRLLLARRMLRLRRIARRLTLIPRLFGLGLRQTLGRSALTGGQNPLALLSKRIGESYNPRDYVFGSKGFTYQNNDTANTQQRTDQVQEQTREFQVQSEPYYDSNYDSLENSNYDSQEIAELRKQQEILNSLTDEQQILLLQQLQNYQQQLNQLQQQLNNPSNNIVQNYQNQEQIADQQPLQYQQPQQNFQNVQTNQFQQAHPEQYQNIQTNQLQQAQPEQYQNIQTNQLPQSQPEQYQQVQQNEQPQTINDQQQEQYRQLQLALLREQQLQQQLQQLQLAQQAQNLKQHHNLAAAEQEKRFQDQSNQAQNPETNVGDRTEGGSYSPPIGIGGSVNTIGSGGTVGVGVNVGIRPPSVDIAVTKPVAPVIKPLPPIVNPIAPSKPSAPAKEPLVPIGILPKPMLNLRGRLFFGAEMGKGAGIKVGAGR